MKLRYGLLLLACTLAQATPFGASVGGIDTLIAGVPKLWAPNYDLNELLIAVWNPAAIANGAVSSFTSTGVTAVTASQATSGQRPSNSSGVLSFSGNDQLTFSGISDPWRYYQGVLFSLQADITDAANGSGTFFYVNGFSTAISSREPYVGYTKGSPNLVTVRWGGSGPGACITSTTWPDDVNFHTIAAWRNNGVAYLQVDDATPVSSGTNCVEARGSGSSPGVIGDFNTSGISWKTSYMALLQGQPSTDEMDRWSAYQLWQLGRQSAIPGGSPWASTPPTSSPYVNPYAINLPADFTAIIVPCFTTNSATCLKQDYASADTLASLTAGLSTIWSCNFTSMTQILGESAAVPSPGACVLFGPSIDASGGSQTNVDPSVNVPTVFSCDGTSECDITMQKSGSTWYSGTLASVNLGGLGQVFNPSAGPLYVDLKVAQDLGNGKSVWGAPFWIENGFRFNLCTVPYEEHDAPENYNSESGGANNHQTEFIHAAPCAYGNRSAMGASQGHDFVLDTGHSWPEAPFSVFDGAFHDMQWYRDKTWTVVWLDGYELGRWPTMAFMMNPIYLTFSWNQLPAEASQASGTYTLHIKSLTVAQGHY
jgi:hypothetical protein